MLVDCKGRYQEYVARFLTTLSKESEDDILAVSMVVRLRGGATLVSFENCTIDDMFVCAEHLRMEASKRYLRINPIADGEEEEDGIEA